MTRPTRHDTRRKNAEAAVLAALEHLNRIDYSDADKLPEHVGRSKAMLGVALEHLDGTSREGARAEIAKRARSFR